MSTLTNSYEHCCFILSSTQLFALFFLVTAFPLIIYLSTIIELDCLMFYHHKCINLLPLIHFLTDHARRDDVGIRIELVGPVELTIRTFWWVKSKLYDKLLIYARTSFLQIFGPHVRTDHPGTQTSCPLPGPIQMGARGSLIVHSS